MSSIATIITAHDGAVNNLKHWHNFFCRNWTEKRWPVYMYINGIENPVFDNVTTMVCNDGAYSTGLIKVLNAIPNEYIIHMCWDYFIVDRVEFDKLAEIRRSMMEHDIGMVKLSGCYAGNNDDYSDFQKEFENPDLYLYPNKRGGVFSLQTSIAKKSLWLKYLIPGWSPYQTEHFMNKQAELDELKVCAFMDYMPIPYIETWGQMRKRGEPKFIRPGCANLFKTKGGCCGN